VLGLGDPCVGDQMVWKLSQTIGFTVNLLTREPGQPNQKQSDNETSLVSKRNENESDSYDAAAYIGIFSLLWGVPCWSARILVGGIFLGHILFNFSGFNWKICYGVGSTHNSGFGFTIAYWQSRLEIVYVCPFSVLGLVEVRKALSRKGG